MKVLKPLQIATTALCEAEMVSVSLVYPIIRSLITKHLFWSEEDSSVVAEFKQSVTKKLQQRFKIDDIGIADKVPILAAVLDPRYLHLSFLSVRQRSIATAVIKEKSKEIFQKKAATQSSEKNSEDKDCEPPSKKKKQETVLSFLMGDQEVDNDDCNGEVDRYLAQKAIATNSTISILDYWKRHSECYPSLASLAKCLLCVPATSVPAESFFNCWIDYSTTKQLKVVSSEFYFHKLITVHIELYLFYRFIRFFIVHRSVLTAENLMKVKAQKSF